jgi:SAM-dependent methyltransferase
MSAEFWLDVGAGIDAEHWAAIPALPGVRRVALDPLLTPGMIASGRLAVVAPDILRVGGEVRPEHSTEAGKQRSYLPFRDGVFARVHCGFVLHLYLEVLDLLALETHRVLKPGGELTVLLPDLADGRTGQAIRDAERALRGCFGAAEVSRYGGKATTFWTDLYAGRVFQIHCRKPE